MIQAIISACHASATDSPPRKSHSRKKRRTVVYQPSILAGETGSNRLLILDARSYAAAIANRAKGGGFEYPPYYTDCDVQFMNLPNIHAIRKSSQMLRAAIANAAQSDK